MRGWAVRTVKRFRGGASLQASAREAFTDWLSNV
jgi:hypothetical protein